MRRHVSSCSNGTGPGITFGPDGERSDWGEMSEHHDRRRIPVLPPAPAEGRDDERTEDEHG
jgi:hypothetical protein